MKIKFFPAGMHPNCMYTFIYSGANKVVISRLSSNSNQVTQNIYHQIHSIN